MEDKEAAAATATVGAVTGSAVQLRHKYSMDATLKRSIPVVEAEAQVRTTRIATLS
jgi:hypothetical protein